jgi:hypothetical protein
MTRERTERARLGGAIGVAAAATAILLGLTSPTAVMAEPQMLTASQMDRLTAGGIHVEVRAFASSSGRYASARTRAYASAGITKDRIDVGVGFAEGQAFACCGSESEVTVHSTANSTGDVVHSSTYAFKLRGTAVTLEGEASYFAYGYTAAFLVALSFEDRRDPGEDAVSASRDAVDELLGPLIGINQGPPRDRVVTGFELAPVFAAGLRWRAVESFLAATPRSIGR